MEQLQALRNHEAQDFICSGSPSVNSLRLLDPLRAPEGVDEAGDGWLDKEGP